MLDDSGVKSRPYQRKAVDFLVSTHGRGAVRAPTGAGKTFIGLQAAKEVGFSRLLILVPRFSALIAWRKALRQFGADPDSVEFSDKVIIVQRWTIKRRMKLYEDMLSSSSSVRIIVMLYNTAHNDRHCLSDESIGIDFVLGDESHKAIRNRRTNTYKAMVQIVRRRKRVFLTATPQSKGPQDLFTTLQLLSPKVFTSYWAFVKRYCIVDDGPYGKEIVAVRKSTKAELRERVAGFLYNIRKSELRGWVPERSRQLMIVEPDGKTRKLYDSYSKVLLAELPNGSFDLIPSNIAKYTKLRQLLTCPAIVHPALGVGNAFLEVLDHAENNDRHIVIFSYFTDAFIHWSKYLTKKKVRHFILKGGMSAQQTEAVIGQYERYANSSKPSILLCSLTFAESFDLLTPETAYFVGWSWDHIENYQAEGRLTRGDKAFCNFFYTCHDGLVDADMFEVVNAKKKLTNLVASDRY